ncbi:hypothetical protein ES705_29009 [subsurface metagenome]|jgi:hypothetical protein
MPTITKDKEYLLHKLEELPPELLQEVLDFVEFLIIKRSGIDYSYLIVQQKSLEKIWASDAENLYEVRMA